MSSESADAPVDMHAIVRDVIFVKLSLVYGQRLRLMYEGIADDLVMDDWAQELDGVALEGIHYALKHLPATDFPPNVQQFRALCQQRPADQPKPEQRRLAMDGGTIVPAFVAKVTRQIHETRKGEEPRKVRVARDFIARVTRPGHQITTNERDWARHYAGIVARYEASLNDAEATAEKKAAAQRLADSFQQQHGETPA
jgi:hypothetical protein